MTYSASGPVEHGASPGRKASVPDSDRSPGMLVVAAAVLAFVVCVANFALGQARAGVVAAIVGLLGFGAGLAWVAMDRRRIRDAERDWPAR
jgi:hypothetical protein